jgi:hypothetical protein
MNLCLESHGIGDPVNPENKNLSFLKKLLIMPSKTCNTCGGRGQITDYSKKNQTSSSYYKHGEQTCFTCGGSGQIHYSEPTPPPKVSNPKPSPMGGTKATKSTGTGGVRGIIALVGFLVAAIPTYIETEENWIAAGIVGLIVGYLAGKWYKAIIVIALILVAFYLFYQN